MLLSVELAPFSIALALLVGFLGIEVVALLAGGSVFGLDEAGAEIAPEAAALSAQFDIDPAVNGALPDVGTLVASAEALEGLPESGGAQGGVAGLLGLGGVPFMIWLAAALLGFGAVGIAVQALAMALLGAALPVALVSAGALVAALAFARRFSRVFARLIPSVETSATSLQFMGGLRGVVSQGTARAGSAAEVRLRDRHGNTHFLRCEPLRAQDVIPEGASVITLRQRQGAEGWVLRILAVD